MRTKIALLFMALVAVTACKKADNGNLVTVAKDGIVYFYSGTYGPPNMYNQNGIYNGDGKVFYQLYGTFHSPDADVQVSNYSLNGEVLNVKAVSQGSSLDIQAVKTALAYDDYSAGETSDRNQFNGLYYCPQENFLYAFDYTKGKIALFFLSTKTRLDLPFSWNENGQSGPEISFNMSDDAKWYISYQPITPAPLTGVYQLRIEKNGAINTAQLFMMIAK